MNTKNVSLLCLALAAALAGSTASAAEDTSTMTVSATLTTACEVSSASSISFGSFAALESSGVQTADSASTFQVACSASAIPKIYASGTREMVNGEDTLPFNLSLSSGAASNDLASTSGAANALSMTQDGSLHDVVIYGRVAVANYKGLPSGAYTTDVTVAVVY